MVSKRKGKRINTIKKRTMYRMKKKNDSMHTLYERRVPKWLVLWFRIYSRSYVIQYTNMQTLILTFSLYFILLRYSSSSSISIDSFWAGATATYTYILAINGREDTRTNAHSIPNNQIFFGRTLRIMRSEREKNCICEYNRSFIIFFCYSIKMNRFYERW